MEKIYSSLFIIFIIMGCSPHPKVDKDKFIAIQDMKSDYGKKYHFILETPYYSSSPHNLLEILPKVKYEHYHIYVDEIKELTGDKVLFSSENTNMHKELDKNTIVKITRDKIEIKNLKKCDSVTKKCWESELNRNYTIVPILQKNANSHSIPYVSSYYYK